MTSFWERQAEERRRRSLAAQAARYGGQAEQLSRVGSAVGGRPATGDTVESLAAGRRRAEAAEAARVAEARRAQAEARALSAANERAVREAAAVRDSGPGFVAPTAGLGAGFRPSLEDYVSGGRRAGQMAAEAAFGPERSSWISGGEAGGLERFVRDWGLSEQEFRLSGERAGEGRFGAAAGWAGLGLAGAVPFAGDALQALGKAGRATSRAADAARAEPRVTIRASDVNRVEGFGEHWFDIPDPSRPGKTTRLPGNSGRDPSGQTTLGGRPMRMSEVPEEVYHVTTNMPGVSEAGMINVSGGLNRGAGGYSGTGAVSTTASKEIADVLQNDMRIFASIKNFETNEDVLDFFLDVARKDNLSDERLALMSLRAANHRGAPGDLGKELFNMWSYDRSAFGGPRPSLIIGDPMSDYWRTVNPEDIQTITIPKSSIPEDALVNNYDLGNSRGLEEIQVYADIPLR